MKNSVCYQGSVSQFVLEEKDYVQHLIWLIGLLFYVIISRNDSDMFICFQPFEY